MRTIYKPKGRAKEYSELACNIYLRCTHKCLYCYCPQALHISREDFHKTPEPRIKFLESLNQDAKALKGSNQRVLLSFIGDCYQAIEEETQLTRGAIAALHEAGLGVIILTKGGYRSMRDFDLLGPGDAYAASLTFHDPEMSLKWEPGAALPTERIVALSEAHERGIETWVSFEPVIFPEETFKLVELTKGFVGHFKCGTLNYHPQGLKTDWKAFGWEMKHIMDRLGVKYYFKKDLLLKMGVNPAGFKQTFVCK